MRRVVVADPRSPELRHQFHCPLPLDELLLDELTAIRYHDTPVRVALEPQEDPNAGRQFDPRLVHLVATSDAIAGCWGERHARRKPPISEAGRLGRTTYASSRVSVSNAVR